MIEDSPPGGVTDQDPHLRLGATLNSLKSDTKDRVQKLKQQVRTLPKVDDEGRSKAPDAAEKYAAKKRTELHLKYRLNHLRSYVGAVARDIGRKRGNLDLVNYKGAHLHEERTAKEYREAADTLRREIADREQEYKEVQDLIREVEAVLALASQYKWPLGDPEAQTECPYPLSRPDGPHEHGPRFPPAATSGQDRPSASPQRGSPSSGDELGGLISKGPVA